MTVRMGSQQAEQNVLLDTGSDLLWVQCADCTKCTRGREVRREVPPATRVLYPQASSCDVSVFLPHACSCPALFAL